MNVVFHSTPRKLYPGKEPPIPIVQGVGCAIEPIWTGSENFTPPGIDLRNVASCYTHYTTLAYLPLVSPILMPNFNLLKPVPKYRVQTTWLAKPFSLLSSYRDELSQFSLAVHFLKSSRLLACSKEREHPSTMNRILPFQKHSCLLKINVHYFYVF
jgi:hypothetical protein